MNKALLGAIIAILVIVGLVTGLLLYLQTLTPTNTSPPSTQSPSTDNSSTPQEGTVAAEIKNFAFLPNKLKIKKGTTVTWTNQDTTKHNVVANDQNNTGGLPTSADLLAKGETFSHTFQEVGTFTYKCAPHPNMTGTVEVVE